MSYFVYMLKCGDGSFYTGSTSDVERRFNEHTAGKGSAYTRSRLPVKLIFTEPHANRAAAQKREAQLKSWTRAEKQVFVKEDKKKT